MRTSRKAMTYGVCDRCKQFGVIANFDLPEDHLCRNCYEEVNSKAWKLQHDEEMAKLKAERLKLINAQELKKRRKKGLAVINLRK